MSNKNHHGFIVTSVTGSVSLKDLPVPVHETRAKAGRFGKASKKPFMIVKATDFYRTKFGQQVQALTHKRIAERRDIPDLLGMDNGKGIGMTVKLKNGWTAKFETHPLAPISFVSSGKPPNKLTSLLNSIRAKNAEKRLNTKVESDTPRPKTPKEILARQMRETGEVLDAERSKMADKSHLANAMRPAVSNKIERASDSNLAQLYSLQDAKEKLSIDQASKFNWTKARINKLVKSGTIKHILILFRAGKLPERMRTRKNLLIEINKLS